MSAASDRGRFAIRSIRRADVPAVWGMLRGLAEYEKLTDLLTGNATLLEDALFGDGPALYGRVAEDGDVLLGYALFHPIFGSFRTRWRMWLEDLYVRPEARGRGVGARLLGEVCREAMARKFRAVDWEVLDWNEAALGFYRAHGAFDLGDGWRRYRVDGDAMAKLAADAGA